MAWTGDVVQETSAAGDPQSNGAAESSVNVVKGHVRSIKLAVESASGVEVPADHDLLTWLVPYAASMHERHGAEPTSNSLAKQTIAMDVPTHEQVVNKQWIIQNGVVLAWRQSW